VLYACTKRSRRVWAWWFSPIIPALVRLKQENGKFEASFKKKKRSQKDMHQTDSGELGIWDGK
jgi:hypothetical protein